MTKVQSLRANTEEAADGKKKLDKEHMRHLAPKTLLVGFEWNTFLADSLILASR